MGAATKQRIIDLQKQVKLARDALERIKYGTFNPQMVAEHALTEMFLAGKKQQLQGLVGHEPRPTT